VLTTNRASARKRMGNCGSVCELEALHVLCGRLHQYESTQYLLSVRTNLWQSMSAPERERLYESVGKSLPVAESASS